MTSLSVKNLILIALFCPVLLGANNSHTIGTFSAFITSDSLKLLSPIQFWGIDRLMIDTDCSINDRHCKGTGTWEDGSSYDGEFKYGIPHGKGTLSWPDGSKYVGQFDQGLRHGWGIQYLEDGSS